ncbi:MAG: SDR family oxidoreductase [Rhizobiaceae bacterium]|nr:SDR family oxidoreductase [Rhizobiaceae bacterium]
MKRVLITGAAGHVGQALISSVPKDRFVVSVSDVTEIHDLPDEISYYVLDVRDQEMVRDLFSKCKPEVVVHLASIVTPPKGSGREFAYDVDVNGTRNIIDACLEFDVKRLVVTSSGAAYGYHPENSVPLAEDAPIRGNYEFPYSYHKRLVEEMLANLRASNPELEQVVLRVGTILGVGIENQITALFHKPRLLSLRETDSPFVFIWDADLAKIILHACDEGKPGIYNVAGDGALGMHDIAALLKKPLMRFPSWLLKALLAIASPLGLSRYGPEQVRFLQFRPVLDNTRLKREFGYVPEKTSLEVFKFWQEHAGL